jgi:phage shock protein E
MKTELKIGLVVLLAWVAFKFLRADPSAKQIPELIGNGALLVDVRTAGEFSSGHIDGAVNIPYDVIADRVQNYETDKSRPVIVYCHSGSRSGAAKRALAQAGYTNVVNGGSFRSMRARLKQ